MAFSKIVKLIGFDMVIECFLQVNPNISQLSDTFGRCRKNIVQFGLVLVLMIIAFELMAHLMFGAKLEEFATFDRGFISTIQVCYMILVELMNLRFKIAQSPSSRISTLQVCCTGIFYHHTCVSLLCFLRFFVYARCQLVCPQCTGFKNPAHNLHSLLARSGLTTRIQKRVHLFARFADNAWVRRAVMITIRMLTEY